MDGFLITETWLLRIQPGLNDNTVRDIKFEYNIQSKKITYLAHLGNFSKEKASEMLQKRNRLEKYSGVSLTPFQVYRLFKVL